jgi:hypothetical protein
MPVPGAAAVTVAVSVTVSPGCEGSGADVSAVVVPAVPTDCTYCVAVGKKGPSPEDWTVTVWLPTVSVDVVRVATPPPSSATAPRTGPATPSRMVTVPVGVAVAGATGPTVTVIATGCPATDGFTDGDTEAMAEARVTWCIDVADVVEAPLTPPPP